MGIERVVLGSLGSREAGDLHKAGEKKQVLLDSDA